MTTTNPTRFTPEQIRHEAKLEEKGGYAPVAAMLRQAADDAEKFTEASRREHEAWSRLDNAEAENVKLEERLAAAEADAEQYRAIIDLCGYPQDGSDTFVKIFQDDATHWWVLVVGSKSYAEPTLKQAIDAARNPTKEG